MHILLAMLCIGALAAPHPRPQNTPPKGADSDFSGESTAQQAAKTALEIIASHFDAVVDATPPPASAENLAPYAHVAGGVLMTPAAGNPTTCGRAQAMNVGTENVLESQLGFVDVIDNVPLKASGLPFEHRHYLTLYSIFENASLDWDKVYSHEFEICVIHFEVYEKPVLLP